MAPWYWALGILLLAAVCAASYYYGRYSGLPLRERVRRTGRLTRRTIKTFFTLKLTQQQETYLVSATVALGVLAFALQYLGAAGIQPVFLAIIPGPVKWALAQAVEVTAFLAVIYFVVRFVWSLRKRRKNQETSEVRAMRELTREVHALVEKLDKGGWRGEP